jgi:acid phosphatase (class A)
VQHPTLVVPLFPVEDFSYPSGHASGAQVQARVLGVVFPDRADDLLKRARQVADGRVVAGVHYASDTEAGENLGDLIFAQLEASPKFKADLAAAAQKDGIPLK